MHQAGFKAGLGGSEVELHPAGLLFAGMGGSGIGADLVKDACTRAMDLPFTIVKHYQFPHHVNKDWHVIAVSYSGDTEETLAVAAEAAKRGVPMTRFTTGGRLGSDFSGNLVHQAEGYHPRQTIGFSWFSLLGFLEGSQILNESVPLEAAMQAVREVDSLCGPQVPFKDNEAKQLALNLYEKVPQIYATPSFFGVGQFFRAMLNENAKKIANVELVPECNHNDMTGWGDDPNRNHFTCLALSHADQNPQIKQRLEYMGERYTAWGLPWHHHVFPAVDSFAAHVVEQARAIQILDYAAFYTAMLRGVDPSEIREIRGLKERLRG